MISITKKIFFFITILFFISILGGFADPVISASIGSDAYDLDNLIVVKIRVDANPGLHGLFFDLGFNGDVLALEGIDRGLLTRRTMDPGTFLYARSDAATSSSIGDHAMVSFVLDEPGKTTRETGILAELRFRVIDSGVPGTSYQFTFNDMKAVDGDNVLLPEAVWNDSSSFVIGEIIGDTFISISQPFENQVIYSDIITVNGICTDNPSLIVKIENIMTGAVSSGVNPVSGAFNGIYIPLFYGPNTLRAKLMDSNGFVFAMDEVRVYRSDEDAYVSIIKPVDHALVNTDKVRVELKAFYDNVKINNTSGTLLTNYSGGEYQFYAYIWLRPGFNTIVATTTSPESVTYTDEITVYYKKNDSRFRIVSPATGAVINSSHTGTLTVTGELGSLSKEGTGNNPDPVLNRVSLTFIHKPFNPWAPTRIIGEDLPALVAETGDATSSSIKTPYYFTGQEIDLTSLENGELEIIAYLNKTGRTWDDKVNRTVYLNNGELFIDLVQPHVFDSDILDTVTKVTDFNDGTLPDFLDLEMNSSGNFTLTSGSLSINDETDFRGYEVTDVVETITGSKYALANRLQEMSIYSLEPGADNWIEVVSRENMYGYDLCLTDLGLLVGVSNYYGTTESGLYLVEGNELKNISLGKPIPHVQFIENRDGLIYLYGNSYSCLYAFNVFSLSALGEGYVTGAVESHVLPNSLFIKQFIISEDGSTVFILTTDNKLSIYRSGDQGDYTRVVVSSPLLKDTTSIVSIIKGAYSGSDYNPYLFIKSDNTTAIACMEHKTTKKLIFNEVSLIFTPGEEFLGAGARNDYFYFLHKTDVDTYEVSKGQVLLTSIYLEGEPLVFTLNDNEVRPVNYDLFPDRFGSFYYAAQNSSLLNTLFCFRSSYNDTGSAGFKYINDAIQGITGFSFAVEPLWTDPAMDGNITFGYQVTDLDSETILIDQPVVSLTTLLGTPIEGVTVSRNYDQGLMKDVITFTLNALYESAGIVFNIGLERAGTISPEVSGLSVYKKNIVLLPRSEDASGETIVSISGFVYDGTVGIIKIDENEVPRQANGAFEFNYPITSTADEKTISIECKNKLSESASIDFKVQLFDSKNDIYNPVYSKEEGLPLLPDGNNSIQTDEDILFITADYYGLIGVTAGYETYKIITDENVETLTLISTGLFELEPDEEIDPGLELGTGYESGSIVSQPVPLVPGTQRIMIYVENPGGKRVYIDSLSNPYIDVYYTLTQGQQKIVITNLDIKAIDPADQYSIGGITMDKEIYLECTETLNEPYQFQADYVITGKVISLYDITDIRIRSFNPALTFSGGKSEIVVELDSLNGFSVNVEINLEESTEGENLSIGFMSTLPFLEWMKTGLNIRAEKDFEDTMIIPDFSLMETTAWSANQTKELKKPLRLRFGRFVPGNSRLTLKVNFETSIEGTLVEINPGEGIYKVLKGNNEVNLTGVRYGTNRVQWGLTTADGKSIAYSGSGKPGMIDFLFELQQVDDYIKTVITFDNSLLTYYDTATLPDLVVTKDNLTTCRVYLNDLLFWEDKENLTSYAGNFTLPEDTEAAVREGKNSARVVYKEADKPEETIEFEFLYDTLNPEYSIGSYTYLPDETMIETFSVIVNEANFKQALFIQESGGENNYISIDPVITYLGNDTYKAVWSNLSSAGLSLPSLVTPVFVEILDYSGKNNTVSPKFYGLDFEKEPSSTTIVHPVTLPWYDPSDNLPIFTIGNDSEVDYLNRPFPLHAKFYSDDITLSDLNLTSETWKEQRINNLSAGNTKIDVNSTLYLEAGGTISFGKGFRVYSDGTNRGTFHVTNKTFDSFPDTHFTHQELSSAITFGFWFRYEDQDFYANDTSYKRILTLFDNGAGDSLYLAYKDEKLYFISEESGTPESIIGATQVLTLTNSCAAGLNSWDFILVGFDGVSGTITISLNNNPIASFSNFDLQNEIDDVLANGADYYFGDNDTTINGHFSIANPFYVNKHIDMSEISRLDLSVLAPANQEDVDASTVPEEADRNYSFDNSGDDITPGYFDLRADGTDFFTTLENVDYSEGPSFGSLKASSARKNFFKVNNDGYVVFDDAADPISSDLTLGFADGGTGITLIPNSSVYTGKYYFGNSKSNHNLGVDKWYSITGRITHKENPGKTARIVMLVNGISQSMELGEGDFHFIYNNKTAAAPTSVTVYIETRTEITFAKDIVLSEGNFILPLNGADEIGYSRAGTSFFFRNEGSFDFWYKPFMTDADGFVQYPVVLFDSEYIKIGAKPAGSTGHSCYYAEIKDYSDSSVTELLTSSPVRLGWQHIHFAYNLSESGGANDLAVLSIDGVIAGWLEADLPLPKSLDDSAPTGDNIFIGSSNIDNVTLAAYAEGYIDAVRLSSVYSGFTYDPDLIPFTYDFADSSLSSLLTICDAANVSGDVSAVSFAVSTRDGEAVMDEQLPELGTVHTIDLTASNAGPYLLKTNMTINGHNYNNRFDFTKDNRPRFTFMEVTPLVISGVRGTIHFGLGYDNSYVQQSTNTAYPGIALRLNWNEIDNDGLLVGLEKTLYLYQDLINDQIWHLGANAEWTEITVSDNLFSVDFPEITPVGSVAWQARSFYFNGGFLESQDGFDEQPPGLDGTIPEASITVRDSTDEHQYKLEIQVGAETGTGLTSEALYQQIGLRYYVTNTNGTGSPIIGTVDLSKTGSAVLFFDDFLPEYGNYKCILSIQYEGQSYGSITEFITWKSEDEPKIIADNRRLNILQFSLLYLNKNTNTAQFVLEYEQNNLNELFYDITVRSDALDASGQPLSIVTDSGNVSVSSPVKVITISGIPLGGSSVVVELNAPGDSELGLAALHETAGVSIVNNSISPELYMTKTVPTYITYNNVSFAWKGYYDQLALSNPEFAFDEIKYSYQFDGKGATNFSTQYMSLNLYALEEGWHTLEVQAQNGDTTSARSSLEVVSFFVDINTPVIDADKISVQNRYDDDGILYAVDITGSPGAVMDVSLLNIDVNGTEIFVDEDGSFSVDEVLLTNDGTNYIRITAFDKVGNETTHTIGVENFITSIIFPETGKMVEYAPAVIVGRINPAVNKHMTIYLFDSMSQDKEDGNFNSWKEASINEDFTFFIEDVFINAGTASRAAETTLEMKIVFDNGRIFSREIHVEAREITMPLSIDFESRALEGSGDGTSVDIHCTSFVGPVASWSIDFNGDGIYDDIVIVQDPVKGYTEEWTHIYSSVDHVTPRVRVITTDGQYFSMKDELVIHEAFKPATYTTIGDPIAMDRITDINGDDALFILRGPSYNSKIETYKIDPDSTVVESSLIGTIPLAGFGIENPVAIVVRDRNNIIIAANRNGLGKVYHLRAGSFGNYMEVESSFFVTEDEIYSMDASSGYLVVTLVNTGTLVRVPLSGTDLLPENRESIPLNLDNAATSSTKLAITKDYQGFIIADYMNQRIVRLKPSTAVDTYYGTYGTGEGEFIMPSLIRSNEERILVYDAARKDIQVFNPVFSPLARIAYDTENEFVTPALLEDLVGLEIIRRSDETRTYYYALMLSKSAGTLALLRLPNWDKNELTIRNNKIIFVKDQEIFTAKPNGADLARILSSDSLPRIEGTVDYPSLSPDGRKVVFTSRCQLYDGSSIPGDDTDNYDYNRFYMMNTDGSGLTQIPLGVFTNYKIERPEFAFNGDKIVFSAKPTGGRWQIYEYDITSGGIIHLFETPGNARYPYYSPDDRYVVFTTDFDGDEDIEIYDSLNPAVRVRVTDNNYRDSYPVWNNLYPGEITNNSLNIESKIGFVSERNNAKELFYIYLAREFDSDLRVVTSAGDDIGSDPDSAAILVPAPGMDSSYPCFTGDGKEIIFEGYTYSSRTLRNYNTDTEILTDLNQFEKAQKPAGMKNSIINLKVEQTSGNDILCTWDPYIDKETYYRVSYKSKTAGAEAVEYRVYTRGNALIEDLAMGVTYLVQVRLEENQEIFAASRWVEVPVSKVAALPSYTIDPSNPYLVRLKAWRPAADTTTWRFFWIIDNQEFPAESSPDFLYEFGTSGTKTISLKVTDGTANNVEYSEPMKVTIVSDIHPVIEYNLADDSSYIDLDMSKSGGEKIDWASAAWVISGPGQGPLPPVSGSSVTIPLNNFMYKINVTLTVRRIPVNGQGATDTIEKTMVIDLDFKDVKPVITYEADKSDPNLIRFSGADSLGNIDWYRVQWSVFSNGTQIHAANGVSTFAYRFQDNSSDANYSVSLTVPRKNDGMTETSTAVVSVGSVPMEPVIDYEIITLKEGSQITGAKLIFSCSGSKGNDIDYSSARWTVPTAGSYSSGSYSEPATQTGPTAVYNLFGIDEKTLVEVSLTLMRRGGTDATTVTRKIPIVSDTIPETNIKIDVNKEKTTGGTSLVFSMLGSEGLYIEWDKTEWQFGTGMLRGPSVRYEVPVSSEDNIVRYTCTVYRTNDVPVVTHGQVDVGKETIDPLITPKRLSEDGSNTYELTVTGTEGIGIDWERTMWFIPDGNENTIQKQGATIVHSFPIIEDAMGYPVTVNMFVKGSTKPYTGYASIDVIGDELNPVIKWDKDRDSRPDIFTINFTGQGSGGSNIDWSQAKWTFGDFSQPQYGPTATHTYPVTQEAKEYKVSLTLVRRSMNGAMETKTVYNTIKPGSDVIVPVIYAKKVKADNWLLTKNFSIILAADQSEGRGLLLDQSIWYFNGRGDSESVSGSWTANAGASVSSSTNIEIIPFIQSFSIDASAGTSTAYSEGFQINRQNTQVGSSCRRAYTEEDSIAITLYVFRKNSEGKLEGKYITKTINTKNLTSTFKRQ